MSWDEIDSLYGELDNNEKIIIDIKSILDREEIEEKGYSYWRL
jgi:UDP-N-acetyl-D-galactosamine dehydrogenase